MSPIGYAFLLHYLWNSLRPKIKRKDRLETGGQSGSDRPLSTGRAKLKPDTANDRRRAVSLGRYAPLGHPDTA